MVLSPLARQIAALGLALCAVALSVAYPLRNYLEQQVAEQQAVAEQHELEEQIADLKAEQAALSDPAYIAAEAKRRLQYVSPGDTVYVVKLPGVEPSSPPVDPRSSDTPSSPRPDAPASGESAPPADSTQAPGDGSSDSSADSPWFSALWDTVSGNGG